MKKFRKQILGYLHHVNLVAGELTQLDSKDVMGHQDVVVRTPFDDDLGFVRRRASFISGFVVHGVFQLPAICCDLRMDVRDVTRTHILQQLYNI